MRSSCLRLRATRGRGPKSLRLIEFTSQLNQYQSMLGWNWMENLTDLPKFIENTLKLLDKHENRISECFRIPDLQCQKCKKIIIIEDQLMYDIDTSIFQLAKKEFTPQFLVETLIKKMI